MAKLSCGPFRWAVLASCTLLGAAESGYVGSKACYGCHADIYRSYMKTDMGRSMRAASELGEGSLPAEATVPVPRTNRTLRVFRDPSGWRQSESEPNVFVDEHPLAYVVGSGANGLTFLVHRGNYLFQAPLSYYSKVNRWDLSPGYEYADFAFSRSTPEGCILCHSGRAQLVPARSGEYRDPPFQELAVGCENCHGPGEKHARDPNVRGAIVNPAKLAPRLAENICMACHQTGDARVLQPGKTYLDFRPGQWLIDTVAILKVAPSNEAQHEQDLLEHNAAMQASRCFRGSRGKLSCLTCHDPHVEPGPAETFSYFRAKCLTCHTEQSCKLALAARRHQTPADDCVGCHMPKRDITVVAHSALTNHRIPASPREALPPWKPSVENGELVIVNQPPGQFRPPSDKTLLRAYNELIGRSPEYQRRYVALLDRLSRQAVKDPYVEAALAHRALSEGKNEEALTHLQTGIKLDEAAVYEDMGKALAGLGRGEEAVSAFLHGIAIDPFRPELRRDLIVEYAKAKRYTEARHAMEEYIALFPEDSVMRGLLARVAN